MDRFFEFLPILVIILASLGPKILEAFQNKKDDEEERSSPAESEEQRRVKEEIRRRIEAARQGRNPQTQPAQRQQQRRPVQESAPPPLQSPSSPARPSPPPLTPTASPDFQDESANTFQPSERFDPGKTQRELEEAKARLAATHQRLAEAKQKTKRRGQRAPAHGTTGMAGAPELVALNAQSIRGTLRNKKQIRQAIILSEVLGKPISMRQS